MSTRPTTYKPNKPATTYFGTTALIAGITSLLFTGASYGIAYMDITPDVFDQLNNITALGWCSLTPITIILGLIGLTRKNDTKIYSMIAIAIVSLPALFITFTLIRSLTR